MSGFINNYYYGKAGKADYTPENLPTSRVQLFFEMLRVRFSGLFGVNLLYALFCLPALIWTGINLVVSGAAASLEELNSYVFTYLLGMVPCLAIAGVGAPGEMYILRNWARDQHAFVMSDFKDNLKANWKQGLVVGLINGLSLPLTYVCVSFYGQMAGGSLIWIVPEMLVITFCTVWWMMNMVIFPMMVTYDMKLSQLIRNSAIIAVARLPWSILFLAGSLLFPAALLFFVPMTYGVLICALIYLTVGFALTGLVYASYANSCFDRFLNPRIEGAPVNMGLRDPSFEDDDEDVDEDDPTLK